MSAPADHSNLRVRSVLTQHSQRATTESTTSVPAASRLSTDHVVSYPVDVEVVAALALTVGQGVDSHLLDNVRKLTRAGGLAPPSNNGAPAAVVLGRIR